MRVHRAITIQPARLRAATAAIYNVAIGFCSMLGTITKIVLGRGFGFIRERGTEPKDVFFHASQLRGGLQFDERLLEMEVEYDVKETYGGQKAENVRPLKS
jgi:cold shock CspA family protein